MSARAQLPFSPMTVEGLQAQSRLASLRCAFSLSRGWQQDAEREALTAVDLFDAATDRLLGRPPRPSTLRVMPENALQPI